MRAISTEVTAQNGYIRHWMLYENLSTRRCKAEMGHLLLTLYLVDVGHEGIDAGS